MYNFNNVLNEEINNSYLKTKIKIADLICKEYKQILLNNIR